MANDNPSFVLRGIQRVVFEQRPVPEPGPDDVVVQVKKTGICGSDIHFFAHGRIGPLVVQKPMVLGHESAGIIAKVGSNVKHTKIGDRVAMEPGATCKKCDDCKAGRYQLCPHVLFAATPPHDGTLGRYYLIPADMTYPLPENLSFEEGALLEPLSVSVHAVENLGRFRSGQSIAVFGCGPIGLLCMAVAKALGASRVIGIDIVPSRLEYAKSYTATDTYLPPPIQEGEPKVDYSRRNAAQMKQQLGIQDRGGQSIDLVVDASGAEVSIQTAMYIVKAGGSFVQVGLGAFDVTVNVGLLVIKEVNFKGSFRYGPGDYPLAIKLAASGKVDLKSLITHRYAFKEADTAFQAVRTGKSEDGKAIIKAVISGPE